MVSYARRIGAKVFDTSQVKGFADTVIAFRGKVHIVEIKDGEQFPKKFYKMEAKEQWKYLVGLLTPDEDTARRDLEHRSVPYHIVWDCKSLRKVLFN